MVGYVMRAIFAVLVIGMVATTMAKRGNSTADASVNGIGTDVDPCQGYYRCPDSCSNYCCTNPRLPRCRVIDGKCMCANY